MNPIFRNEYVVQMKADADLRQRLLSEGREGVRSSFLLQDVDVVVVHLDIDLRDGSVGL